MIQKPFQFLYQKKRNNMEHALDFHLDCLDRDDEERELYPFDEFLNSDWCDHGFDSQNECPICNLDLQQAIMDRYC